MATTKATTSAKSTATATETPKVEVSAKVLAAVREAIKSTATTTAKELSAIDAREQSLLLCADKVREAKIGTREVTQDYLKPLFVEIYAKANVTKEHAESQCSRMISFAFPGGRSADEKKAAKAATALAEARAYVKPNGKKLNTNELLPISRATAKLDKKTGKIIRIESAGGSGGHNAKKPAEAFKLSVGNAVTAAKTAKMDLDQMAVLIAESFKENEFDLSEVLEALTTAMED